MQHIIYYIPGLDKGECSEEDIERAKTMVPKSLEHYVEREYDFCLVNFYQIKAFICEMKNKYNTRNVR